MLGPALPLFEKRFSVSESSLGLSFLFYFLGLAIGDFAILLLTQYFKKKDAIHLSKVDLVARKGCFSNFFGKFTKHSTFNEKFLLLGLACTSLMLAFISLTLFLEWNSYILFIFLHVMLGIFVSFVDVSANAIPAGWPPNISAAAVTLLHFGFGIGAVVCPYVFEGFGLVGSYLAFGVFGVFSLFISILFLVLLKKKKTRGELIKHLTASSSLSIRRELKQLVFDGSYWFIIASLLLYVGIETVLGGWISSYFIELNKEKVSTVAVSVYWAGVLAGRLMFSFFQFLTNKLCNTGSTNSTVFITRIWAPFSIATSALFIILGSSSTSDFAMLILTAFLGISLSALFPLIITITGNIYIESATGSSLLSVMGALLAANVGAGIFPFLTGLVANHSTIQHGLWFGVACAVILNIMLNVFSILRWRKRKQETQLTTDLPIAEEEESIIEESSVVVAKDVQI